MIAFEVIGTPAPKGSGRAMLIGGRARYIAGGSSTNARAMKSWDAEVRSAARAAVADMSTPVHVASPVRVVLVFRMRRPGGHWAKRGGLKASAPLWPAAKPDTDKLARCTLDSLTGLLWDDDSRICELVVSKVYAAPGGEGAYVEVVGL